MTLGEFARPVAETNATAEQSFRFRTTNRRHRMLNARTCRVKLLIFDAASNFAECRMWCAPARATRARLSPFTTTIMPPVPTDDALELVDVTPELAMTWLATMAANRRLNATHVERLAEDIRRGDWRQTFDPVRFNKKGELVDGQHRLSAIVAAGKTVPIFVARGLDARAMAVIDTGRARSVADAMTINGVANARKLAAAAKALYYYDLGKLASSGPAVSYAQLQRTIKAHPFLPEAVEQVVSSSIIQPHAQLAMVYCLAHEKHPKKAEEWLEAVQEGENIGKGNAAFELRKRLLSMRGKGSTTQMRGPAVAALIINSWNLYLANRRDVTPSELLWRNTRATAEDEFPAVR